MKNIPITQNTSIQFPDDEKRDKSEGTANELVLCTSGSGKAIRPWDNLKSCPKCGCAAWLVGKDGAWFESGSPYKVGCLKCGHESISSDDFQICKKDWNKAIRPWDDLKPCPKCGCAAFLVGKDGTWFDSGSPYKVVCLKCGHESISSDDFQICKKDWNDNFQWKTKKG